MIQGERKMISDRKEISLGKKAILMKSEHSKDPPRAAT